MSVKVRLPKSMLLELLSVVDRCIRFVSAYTPCDAYGDPIPSVDSSVIKLMSDLRKVKDRITFRLEGPDGDERKEPRS